MSLIGLRLFATLLDNTKPWVAQNVKTNLEFFSSYSC